MEEDKRLKVPKRTSKREGQQINITMTRNGGRLDGGVALGRKIDSILDVTFVGTVIRTTVNIFVPTLPT